MKALMFLFGGSLLNTTYNYITPYITAIYSCFQLILATTAVSFLASVNLRYGLVPKKVIIKWFRTDTSRMPDGIFKAHLKSTGISSC